MKHVWPLNSSGKVMALPISALSQKLETGKGRFHHVPVRLVRVGREPRVGQKPVYIGKGISIEKMKGSVVVFHISDTATVIKGL